MFHRILHQLKHIGKNLNKPIIEADKHNILLVYTQSTNKQICEAEDIGNQKHQEYCMLLMASEGLTWEHVVPSQTSKRVNIVLYARHQKDMVFLKHWFAYINNINGP